MGLKHLETESQSTKLALAKGKQISDEAKAVNPVKFVRQGETLQDAIESAEATKKTVEHINAFGAQK